MTNFKIFENHNHKVKRDTMQKNRKELQGIREDLGSFKMEVGGLGRGVFATTLGIRRKSEQRVLAENVVLETEEEEKVEEETVSQGTRRHSSPRYLNTYNAGSIIV